MDRCPDASPSSSGNVAISHGPHAGWSGRRLLRTSPFAPRAVAVPGHVLVDGGAGEGHETGGITAPALSAGSSKPSDLASAAGAAPAAAPSGGIPVTEISAVSAPSRRETRNRWKRWGDMGVFARKMEGLASAGDEEKVVMIDATYLKAHRTASSLRRKREGRRPARASDRSDQWRVEHQTARRH